MVVGVCLVSRVAVRAVGERGGMKLVRLQVRRGVEVVVVVIRWRVLRQVAKLRVVSLGGGCV